MSFKAAVLLHVDRVNNREELAQAMGMSITDLARKFKVEFGESVYSWLLKQENYLSVGATRSQCKRDCV